MVIKPEVLYYNCHIFHLIGHQQCTMQDSTTRILASNSHKSNKKRISNNCLLQERLRTKQY